MNKTSYVCGFRDSVTNCLLHCLVDACRGRLAHSAVLLSCILLVGCNNNTYVVSYEPGPIQVFGSDRELWFFVEIDRMVTRPNRAYDAPNRIPVGHMQEVFLLKRTGELTHVKVRGSEITAGVSFNMNYARPFRFDDRIMLYKAGSRDNTPTVFEWTGQHFERLPWESNARFLKENNLEGRTWEVYAKLDAWSITNYWQLIHSDLTIRDITYRWDDWTVVQSVRFEQGNYRIEFSSTNNVFVPIVIEFDGTAKEISESDFKQLSREDSGYPKTTGH